MPLEPALPVPRPGLGLSWPLLVAGGSFLMVFARAQHLLLDPDTYWHIAAGRWMLAHHSIPTVDPFSYTFLGAPWTAHEVAVGDCVCGDLTQLAAGPRL